MARVAVRALVAGTVACFMTACVAGEIFTCLYMFSGFVQGLEFLKKSWNLPSNFLDLEKVWNNGEKSRVFFKAVASALQLILSFGQILFNLDCTFAAIMKKALFLLFLKVFLNPLSTNSAQNQFSPNNIHMLPRAVVMKVNKIISKEKMLWSIIKLSQVIL